MKGTLIILIILWFVSCGWFGQKKVAGPPVVDSLPGPAAVVIPEPEYAEFHSEYSYGSFPAKVFTGELAAPDFTDNEYAGDREFVDRITAGCEEEGVNFGGHYTIIHVGCGAMCQAIYIVDRISGKIFMSLTDGGRWGFMYRPDSNLLIANFYVFTDDNMTHYTTNWQLTPELYVWENETLTRIQ
jgi:hypothetical protein